MRQLHFVFDDICTTLDNLLRIREAIGDVAPTHVLLHIYLSGLSSHQGSILLEALDRVLPAVPRIGISEFPAYTGKMTSLLKINALIAEAAEFHTYHIPCVRGGETAAAEACLEELQELQDIKAIEICSANQLVDTSTFVETLGARYAAIPIFGALSKPARLLEETVQKQDDSFSVGSTLASEGFHVAVYTGKFLEVYLNYIQSWRALGQKMCFRLEKNPVLGSSALCQIEGAVAVEIFLKYLGIPWDENFLQNTWYFPLLISRDGINICFTPIGCKDGTIYYGGRMYEHERIQFAYCTREEILDASFAECQKLQKLSPEALFLIICCNRYAFMRDEEQLELSYYKKCQPEFVYCHSYGEIAYKDKKGGTLNSALVSIALRECHEDKKTDSNFYSIPKIRKFANSSIPLSFIVSHFFHQMSRELMNYQNNLEQQVRKITQENESLSVHIVLTLVETIDAKDNYTKGHSGRVADYAKRIAKEYGYNEKQLSDVYMVGLLHDVGKIGVPDYVINKKTKLTEDEFDVIKEHPEKGAHILGNIIEMPNLAIGAHWHHERYDGKGYPDGLQGEAIPEVARIIAVADAYDAMTSNRSYRTALPQEVVRREIVNGKNRQFDPVFADIMLAMIDADTDYQMREIV